MMTTFDDTAVNMNRFLNLHNSASDWWYIVLLNLILPVNFKSAKVGYTQVFDINKVVQPFEEPHIYQLTYWLTM